MLLGRKVTTIVNQPDKRWHQAKPTIALCPEHGTHSKIVNTRRWLGMVMMLMMMTSGCLIGVSFGWNAFKVGKIDILIPSSSTLVVLAALYASGLVIVNS